ncbi:major facilitator superfamily domain-containing protein [Aspergillus karnatakaensis]|uniref:putative MFS transporter n=1 Tax=Aspergillus karnatakaensis TaxID=1810916 RepID=UPI003CCCBDCA
MGANDSAYGLETHYNLTYTTVSLVFLSPIGGYTLAALTNNTLHHRFGRRGIALLSPGCHLLAYIVNCLHPPYPVLVVSFIFAGLGNGLADSAWNAWIGDMQDCNQVLGLLHGWYGLGAVLAPLVATSLVTEARVGWWWFYYIMVSILLLMSISGMGMGMGMVEQVACAFIELAFCLYAFWDENAAAFKASQARHMPTPAPTSTSLEPGAATQAESETGGIRRALFIPRYARITWTMAIFLFGYVGVEVAVGGWTTTFMLRIRGASEFASGMAAMGFWLGITVGRVVLGFVTPRVGEKVAIVIYFLFSIAASLLVWLVPNFYASVVAVSIQGFFLGPMFPGAVVVATRLLPKALHVSAIGFAAAFGASGAAVLPFAVGAVAQAKGVKVLQPFVVGLSVAILGLWVSLPRIPKRG